LNPNKKVEGLIEAIEKVIIGKEDVVKLLVVALLSRGHVLLEDVPGVGKTTLARALAKAIACRFSRVQFTPDLLPSDILGVSIYSVDRDEFVFKAGPIFANVVLADEINRTTPRTQSALLEAMNDFHVSVDSVTHRLPMPFMVIATQNPIEYHGTYPLPESQMDRFLLRTRIGYPNREDEKKVITSHRLAVPLDDLEPVLTGADVLEMQDQVKKVRVDEAITEYILSIAEATRRSRTVEVGVSPRGCLMLSRAAQAKAAVEGRDYCTPDDVKELAVAVLAHRLIESVSLGVPNSLEAEGVMGDILETVEVPL